MLGSISDLSIVWFDRGDACAPSGLLATSLKTGDESGLIRKEEVPGQTGSRLASVRMIDPESDEAITRLRSIADATGRGAGQDWSAVECAFEDGTRDVILVRTDEVGEEMRALLDKIWPGLRRMCLHEMSEALSSLSDDAMLWMVRRKVSVSVLVLDEDANIIRTNAAARELLERGDVLQETAGGLGGISDRATAGLQRMVKQIFQDAEEGKEIKEYVVFMRQRKRPADPEKRPPVPMTLSLYEAANGRRALIAMLPTPPERQRIEHFAQKMGLTPSEARVAALIRDGHSNREAAKIAGLKVETFNTYAKRVLAKMNVSGRADMAQMLTWQAAMERQQ